MTELFASSSVLWLSTELLAACARISVQKARRALSRAHEGLPWRGVYLDVRCVRGRGGRSGRAYEVAVSSLPKALQETYRANLAPSDASPRHDIDTQAEFKLSVIRSVRRLVADGLGKDAAVKAVCAEARYPYGRRRGKNVGERTVRDWLRTYEREGTAGLMRKQRSDVGQPLVTISRQWDALAEKAGLDDSERQRIAAALIRRIKGEWRRGEKSWHTVQLNVRPDLIDLTGAAIPDISEEALRNTCLVPRDFILNHRKHRAVAIRRQNAGRSAAIQTPRVRRDRSGLRPMEWIAADVCHLDILVRRADGTVATPKAVAWTDLATNRAFVSAFLMNKGEMIATRHVAQSFAEMAAHPDWGVPGRLYADRGGEYNWLELAEDLTRLKRRVEVVDWADFDGAAASGLRRSRPYNPQSKVIETLFAALPSVLGQLPGYIGGDRFNKKTENQGTAPIPFPGSFEDFQRALARCLDYYHGKPQSGHLAGKSPHDRFGEFVAGGWQSTVLELAELAVAFSIEGSRQVMAGGRLSWKGVAYRHDALLSLAAAAKVRVRQPIYGDRSRLFVFDDDGQFLCVAEPEEVYEFDDPRGAGEQRRRTAELNRQVRALETEGDRRDPEEVIGRAVEACGLAPHASVGERISISPEYRAAALAYKALPEPSPMQTEAEQLQRRKYEILMRMSPASEDAA